MPSAGSARVAAAGRAGWRRWLEKNHAASAGVWLVVPKKGRPGHMTPDDVTEEALCFGWIDSVPKALDANRSLLYVAPRKPRSAWSKLNRQRAERMIAAGKMRPAGAAKIAAAKKDGSWSFLEDVQKGTIPPDLASALRREAGARKHFDAFPPSSKRIILEWIKTAKTPETRKKRVDETARLAARNIRANHYRQPGGR